MIEAERELRFEAPKAPLRPFSHKQSVSNAVGLLLWIWGFAGSHLNPILISYASATETLGICKPHPLHGT